VARRVTSERTRVEGTEWEWGQSLVWGYFGQRMAALITPRSID